MCQASTYRETIRYPAQPRVCGPFEGADAEGRSASRARRRTSSATTASGRRAARSARSRRGRTASADEARSRPAPSCPRERSGRRRARAGRSARRARRSPKLSREPGVVARPGNVARVVVRRNRGPAALEHARGSERRRRRHRPVQALGSPPDAGMRGPPSSVKTSRATGVDRPAVRRRRRPRAPPASRRRPRAPRARTRERARSRGPCAGSCSGPARVPTAMPSISRRRPRLRQQLVHGLAAPAPAVESRSPSTSPSRTSATVATSVAVSNASTSTVGILAAERLACAVDGDEPAIAAAVAKPDSHRAAGETPFAGLGPLDEGDRVVEVRLEVSPLRLGYPVEPVQVEMRDRRRGPSSGARS